MVSVSLDDTCRGQHCSWWNLRLCGPAGLDPQCHAERQHPFWEGIWWRKARNAWFLSCFLSRLCETQGTQATGSPPTVSLMLGLFMFFRYNSVLNSCCLQPDLAILPNSDLTEVQAFCSRWGRVCSREDPGRWVAGLCWSHLLGVHLKCVGEKPTQWDSLSLVLHVRKAFMPCGWHINTTCFKDINMSYVRWILNKIPFLVQSSCFLHYSFLKPRVKHVHIELLSWTSF